MSLTVWLGIALLGGIGATTRFLIDGAIGSRGFGPFPFGTLAVNLTGAFALGVLAGVTLAEGTFALVATGALGSFTTLSTWMLEAQRLAEDGEFRLASANVLVSLVAGLTLAWIGLSLGEML